MASDETEEPTCPPCDVDFDKLITRRMEGRVAMHATCTKCGGAVSLDEVLTQIVSALAGHGRRLDALEES